MAPLCTTTATGPGASSLQGLVGHGGEFRRAAGDAHAVRADHGDAGAAMASRSCSPSSAAFRVAAFAEACGIDGGAARAGGGAVAQDPQRGFRGREDREMVGRLGQGVDVGVAGRAPDLLPVRIDGKDAARQTEALEIVLHALRPVTGTVGGADQNHVVRVEQMARWRCCGGRMSCAWPACIVAPSPVKPGLARVSHSLAQVGQARLAGRGHDGRSTRQNG